MPADRVQTKTPGIFKRGNRYSYTWRDNLGSQHWGSAKTLAEARTLRAASMADVARGEYRSLSRMTLAEYAPRWITSYRGRTARGIGPETLHDYRRALGLDAEGNPTGGGAVGYFGRMMLAEIGAPELRGFADHVASRGVKRDTVRLALAPVKALLATAHEDGLIRSNPAAGLRNLLPPDVEREAEKVKALAPEELRALLDALPAAWRLFFGFLAESGLRIGEAVEVRWRDVDLGSRWLTVERRYYRGRVGLPKGRKSRRVPLSVSIARALWELRKATRAGDDDLVFTAGGGARIDTSNLMTRVLKPAAVEAGLGEWVNTKKGRRAETWVGFHSFRHTCATMLLRSGWNAPQVQRMLGHSDPGFTLRRYVHLLDSDLPEPGFLDALPVAEGGNGMETRGAETGRDDGTAIAAEMA